MRAQPKVGRTDAATLWACLDITYQLTCTWRGAPTSPAQVDNTTNDTDEENSKHHTKSNSYIKPFGSIIVGVTRLVTGFWITEEHTFEIVLMLPVVWFVIVSLLICGIQNPSDFKNSARWPCHIHVFKVTVKVMYKTVYCCGKLNAFYFHRCLELWSHEHLEKTYAVLSVHVCFPSVFLAFCFNQGHYFACSWVYRSTASRSLRLILILYCFSNSDKRVCLDVSLASDSSKTISHHRQNWHGDWLRHGDTTCINYDLDLHSR